MSDDLVNKLEWVRKERDATFALTLKRAETAETKLAEAVKTEREAVCRIIHDAITAGRISPRGGVLLQDAIRARTEGEG